MKSSINLRKLIRKKEISLGSWIQLADPFSAEIMARAGFDWLAVDMEHGLIGHDAAFRLIQTIGNAGVVPLVRLHENDPSTIRRMMDAGACGVIVPMVNTAEDALRAVNAVKYYPQGQRSFGLGRAHHFGREFDTYLDTINTDSIVAVQIEHKDAIPHLNAILDVKGIDAIVIGPYDLSGSMGIPGKFSDPRFTEAIADIIERVKKTPIALGFHIVHPLEQDLDIRIQQGFTFIGYGMDTIFLQDYACASVDLARTRF